MRQNGVLFVLLAGAPALAGGVTPVLNPLDMPGDARADYSTSPVGDIPSGTPVVNQYASLGMIHDGSATTPPPADQISSESGVPALRAAGDNDLQAILEITFTEDVCGVGAFSVVQLPSDFGPPPVSIRLSAFDANDMLIGSVFLGDSDLEPFPGLRGGFIGLRTDTPIARVAFTGAQDFVQDNQPILGVFIDDLRIEYCDPAPPPPTVPVTTMPMLALIGLGVAGAGVVATRRRRD